MLSTPSVYRAAILRRSLKFLAIVGAIAYLPSMYFSIVQSIWPIAVVDTLAFVLVILGAYLPGLSSNFRLSLFVACLFFVAVVVLLLTGPEGAGYIWFLCAVLVSALFGKKAVVMAVIVLSMVAMIVYAAMLGLGILDFDVHPSSALLIAANLFAISIALAYIIRELIGGLEESLAARDRLTEELHHRVKNNMQVALSIVSLELDSGSDLPPVRSIERRMRVLATANEMILTHPLEASLGLGELARLLTDTATGGYCAREKGNASDDLLRLDSSNAVALAVGASELLSLMQVEGAAVVIAVYVEGEIGRIIFRFSEDIPFEKIARTERVFSEDPVATALLNSASVHAFGADGEGGPGFQLTPLIPLRVLASLPEEEASEHRPGSGRVPAGRFPVL